MFEELSIRFSKIVKNIRGQGKITDQNVVGALRDVRRALLEADVNYQVAKQFISRVKDVASGKSVFTSVTPGQQFVKIILDELTSLLGEELCGVNFSSTGRTVILLAGLQGAGKTTTASKLACFLKNKMNKNPYLIAADLQRPAAIDQLEVLAKQVQVPVFAKHGLDLSTVINNGLADSLGHDVVIIDTAGRLHIDRELMLELDTVVEIAKPNELLYVADGMTGQDAVNSSKSFSLDLDLTGVILTKMDGDSRGGAALSIKEVTKKPIKFLGTGEGFKDFEAFQPERLARRILGMGDVVGLVEKAQEAFDIDNAEKLTKKLEKNSFTLVDFQEQLSQMGKMGSMSDIFSMVPGFGKLGKINFDERQLKWTDAIIKSMTPIERLKPTIINGSRRKRIAKGSGRTVQEVNQLLKQFSQMQQMMKKIGRKGGMRLPFGLK
jgi:signal recognition particle subunit SRP54